MSEMLLVRTPQGSLAPTNDEDAERIRKYKVGSVIRCNIVQMRNYKFHKKFFALVGVAYDLWAETQPQAEYKGIAVQPEFERFRRDLMILAGYYRPVFAINGEMRLEAESVSFASMTEERFEALFSQVLNVILAKILTGMTEEKMRASVDLVLGFDS